MCLKSLQSIISTPFVFPLIFLFSTLSHFSPFLIPFLSFHSWFRVSHSLAFSSTLPFLQVAALQEEKSSLLAENQVLMERLNQSDSIEDINSPAGRRHLQLQTQLEQLQEETFRSRFACNVERNFNKSGLNWLMPKICRLNDTCF